MFLIMANTQVGATSGFLLFYFPNFIHRGSILQYVHGWLTPRYSVALISVCFYQEKCRIK